MKQNACLFLTYVPIPNFHTKCMISWHQNREIHFTIFYSWKTGERFTCAPGMYWETSLTASSSRLMALAISLIVSRKVRRSVISSGMRDRIFLREADLRFNSWKGSSVREERYSRLSWSLTDPCIQFSLKICVTAILNLLTSYNT